MEMNWNYKLPLYVHDEENGLDYTLHGDYYLPDIDVDPGEPIGKYGRARLRYLQEYRSSVYTRLLLSGKLHDDLHQVDAEAERLLDMMIPQIAKNAGVTATLKASDPMKWVGMMNTIKAQIEEIIWNELISTWYNSQAVSSEAAFFIALVIWSSEPMILLLYKTPSKNIFIS